MSDWICLFIAPLKEVDSRARERSQDVFENLVIPACAGSGFSPDFILSNDPGAITTNIFNRILNAAVIVADLTDGNFSVAYELAFAHMRRKATIPVIQSGFGIPYDVRDMRVIQYDYSQRRTLRAAIPDLIEHLNRWRNIGFVPSSDNPLCNALSLIEEGKKAGPSHTPVMAPPVMAQRIAMPPPGGDWGTPGVPQSLPQLSEMFQKQGWGKKP